MKTEEIKTFILVSDGFDEPAVVECLCRVREQGASATLVGLYSGLLSGYHGLTIRPDFSLNQLEQQYQTLGTQTAVILSGRTNLTALLTDPRVHRLVEQTLSNEGFVAVMSTNSEWPLLPADLAPTAQMNLLLQDRMNTDDFIQEILKRVSI
jgi:hypothetical protein